MFRRLNERFFKISIYSLKMYNPCRQLGYSPPICLGTSWQLHYKLHAPRIIIWGTAFAKRGIALLNFIVYYSFHHYPSPTLTACFTCVGVDGGHDGVCSPRPVDPVVWGVQKWYQGAIQLSSTDVHNLTLRLDNGSVYVGTLEADNNSIAFVFVNTTNSSGPGPVPPVPPGHNMTWQRRAPNATGVITHRLI